MISHSLRKIIAPVIEQIDQREEHGSPVSAEVLRLAARRFTVLADDIEAGVAE